MGAGYCLGEKRPSFDCFWDFRMFLCISSLHFLSITIFLIFLVLPSSNGVDGKYKACSSILFSCGSNYSNIGYPFWGEGRQRFCGHPSLQLHCFDEPIGHSIFLKIGQEDRHHYNVLNMNFSGLNVALKLKVLPDDISCKPYKKAFDEAFKFSPSVVNITLVYNCSQVVAPHSLHDSVPCFMYPTQYNASQYTAYYMYNMSARKEYAPCSSFEVPVLQKQLDLYNKGEIRSLTQVLNEGFEVNYEYSSKCLECKKSSGLCGSSGSDFVYLCKSGAFDYKCPNQKQVSIKARGLIGFIGSATLAVVIGVVIFMIRYLRKRRLTRNFGVFWKSKAENFPNVNTFLQIYGSFALLRHTYADIKQMTNGFRDKLGEGGFGTVYKGKLLSGRLVAVKVLKQTKGNGEDFLNELATISRTNHVNIVTLLGFCFEGNKRALIYEFLPNGSLEKFTYHGAGASDPSLPWGTIFNIATGIARGLDYLHRGCNARILHFDIKPHNILLDEEFRPKISDFGLARLCPLQESTISMLEARGTIGYIAPEVFCRTIGRVSHKSDVYSFGMMVIDMICGRKNLSADLQRSSEVYFPEWIYDRLELEEETPFQGTSNGEEQAIQKKMIIVSLWCIQTYPSNRPSMSRVVDMLQASIESIEMPPKLNLSSPPRSALDTLPVPLTETSD